MKKILFILTFILIIFLPWHAFLVTWGSSFLGSHSDFLPQASLILASWKEILIFFLGMGFLWKWWKSKTFPISFYAFDWIFLAFLSIALLSGIFLTQNIQQMIWGFKYDFLFFALFYIIRGLQFSEKEKQWLIYGFFGSAGLVMIWGLLNYFVFPKDFLLHFGYSEHISSYDPKKPLPIYHTIEGSDTVRLASSFSGPNQYGFYLVIVIAFIFSGIKQGFSKRITNYKLQITNFFRASPISNYSLVMRNSWAFILLITLAIPSLILTFSRSSWIGALGAIGIIILFWIPQKIRVQFLFISGTIFLITISSTYFLFQDFFQQKLLRAESSGGHYERSVGALKEIVKYPLGTGLGTAGPASIRDQKLHTVYVPETEILNFMERGLTTEQRNEIWFYDNNPHGTIEFKPHNTTELRKISILKDIPEDLRNDIFALWKQYYHERIAENWHLQMFQEFGWSGGILWLTLLSSLIFFLLIQGNWLALGGAASLIGLSLTGLFLHSFEDASTSLSLFLLLGLTVKKK